MKKLLIFSLFLLLLIVSADNSDALKENVIVISYAGDVRIIPTGTIVEVECEPGMFLGTGDRVKTGPESYLEIAFNSSTEKYFCFSGILRGVRHFVSAHPAGYAVPGEQAGEQLRTEKA